MTEVNNTNTAPIATVGGLVARTVASVGIAGAYHFADRVLTNAAGLASSHLAVSQLQDVDQPVQQAMMQTLSGAHMPELVLTAALGAVWWSPIKRLAKKITSGQAATMSALFIASSMAVTSPAHAYYDVLDNPEFVEILPNQTAFAIPEQGANRQNQAAFMSEQYLTDNKVAMKRFQVPHVLIHNPSVWTRDYYVPSTKLLVVDRTPYMREWVAESNRGTSSKDESFRFESGESVNITVGVVIAAEVTEDNAAKFVYHYGAKTNGAARSNDPNATFASVIEGRSLSEVMDTNVRGKVQAVLAREFGRRSTDDCIKEKAQIIDQLEKEVRDAFATDGITIKYAGFATPLNYDNPEIQKAIDLAFISSRQVQAARTLEPVLPTLKAQAMIKVNQSIGEAIAKWNGSLPNLPSVVVLPQDVLGELTGLVTGGAAALAAPSHPGQAPATATFPAPNR